MTSRQRTAATSFVAGGSAITARPLTNDDLEQVLALERAAYPTPWSPAMFTLELAKPHGLALGAWDQSQLLAHAILAPYDGVWHLLNLAVTPERRRTGLGRAVLRDVLQRLENRAILEGTEPLMLTLEVRVGNTAAQQLYVAHGFLPAGVRPRYYADTGEDALVLWRTPATLRGSFDDVPNADPAIAQRFTR